MSFRKYLYSILCAALIVPFIALGIQQCFNAKDTLENRELVGKLTAELVGREIQSRLEIAKTVVEAAANKLASEPDRNTEALNTYLKELVAHIPYILNIHFDNVSGRSIAFYPPVNKDGESNIGVDHSSREHWKNIISSNSHVISDVVKAVGAADVPIVNITIPARDKRGKLVGYAVCALNLNRLVQNVTSRIAPGEFNIWVFDSRGVPVYTNSIVKELTPYIPAEIVKDVLSKGGDWVTIDRGGPLDLTGYLLPLPNQDWSVGIFRKLPDKETEIGVLVWTNLIFFFVVLLITLIISSLGTQSLINKIKLLMFYAFDYKGSRLNVKTLKSPTEFSQLQKLIVRLNNQKKAVRSDLTDINLAVEREFHKRISGYSEKGAVLNDVFDDIDVGIALTDKNGTIRYLNGLARKLLPYASSGEQLQDTLEENFSSSTPVAELLSPPETGISLTLNKDGSVFSLRRYGIKENRQVASVYVLIKR